MGFMKYCLIYLLLSPILVIAADSTCHGTTANGRLENGVELPRSGPNFVTYSNIARAAGRTYVHSEVREIVVEAYALLEREQPLKVYKYAETGFKTGGQFKPHKTPEWASPKAGPFSELFHTELFRDQENENQMGQLQYSITAHLAQSGTHQKAAGMFGIYPGT